MTLASAHAIESAEGGARAIVMSATFGSFLVSLEEADELITALAIARIRALDPTPLPEAEPRPPLPPKAGRVQSSLEDLA